MAGPLAAIERFFERVFERPPARLFAPRLEREYLQRELIRTMEAERQVRGRTTYVPAAYRLQLNAADAMALAAQPSLASELQDSLRTHARAHNYVLSGRPTVAFDGSPQLERGEVEVLADASSVARPAERSAHRPPPPPQPPNGGVPFDPGHTQTFEAARPPSLRASIAVNVPGRAPWRVTVNSGRLRVGRALDNDVVLADDRVSRHHGQISVRFGTLVYADLGSTNGSFLNGARVTEIALGPGDVLQLGGSALTVEPPQ